MLKEQTFGDGLLGIVQIRGFLGNGPETVILELKVQRLRLWKMLVQEYLKKYRIFEK